MKVSELILLLMQLDPRMDIFIGISSEGGRIKIEPVTESCEDKTIIGYVITDCVSDKTTH